MRFATMLAGLAFAAAAGLPQAPAIAQEAQGAGGAPSPSAWVKVCSENPTAKKEVCQVMQQLLHRVGETTMLMASATIRETPGEARKSLLLSVPPLMVIPPGVQVQIDGAKPEQARYTICAPNQCYAELPIDNGFINRLKAGGTLHVTAINQQGKPARYDLTLIGFTKAYDGPGASPEELQQFQEQRDRELNARAQTNYENLMGLQREAAGGEAKSTE